jgi:hypothetical protein
VDAGDAGLFVATWPKSDYLPEGVLYRNEVWTGIEYQVAAHLIWEGMLEQALIACRAVHDRYHPLKRNPYNEVECGDHYARAFASWGVYLALAGFDYNGPTAAMKFNPQLAAANFKAAFTAAEGWGTYAREVRADGQSDGLLIHWGQVRLREVTVPVNAGFEDKAVTVEVGGKPVRFEALKSPGFVTVRFTEEAVLKERDALEVRLG